jgi:hypothetical protein
MTTRADFTNEEWARLERAPVVASMAISLADPGGPIETLKESMAAIKTVAEAAMSSGQSELVEAVAISAAQKRQRGEGPLGDFRPRGAQPGEQILEEVRAVNALVTAKATPEEAAAFREWLLAAAEEAAEAAKEGGFLGFNAELVSEGEERMLEKLREALSPPSG